jgi:proteasome lid subunit RPN8/RPN11
MISGMNNRIITIDASVLDQIRTHAEKTYPYECCGVLIGHTGDEGNRVTSLYVASNRHEENRKRRFLISPEDYRAAEEIARKQKQEILGFYHSHPDHPAEPSTYDREHAWPWFAYGIVSVREGAAADIAFWQLRDDRSSFEHINHATM